MSEIWTLRLRTWASYITFGVLSAAHILAIPVTVILYLIQRGAAADHLIETLTRWQNRAIDEIWSLVREIVKRKEARNNDE